MNKTNEQIDKELQDRCMKKLSNKKMSSQPVITCSN